MLRLLNTLIQKKKKKMSLKDKTFLSKIKISHSKNEISY